MIELADAMVYVNQLKSTLLGKTIETAEVMQSPHTFGWMNLPKAEFESKLLRRTIVGVHNAAASIVIELDTNDFVLLGEDVTIEWGKTIPEKHQLLLTFTDHTNLVVRVKMYGFLMIGTVEELVKSSPYVASNLLRPNPTSPEYDQEYFLKNVLETQPKASLKQAIATKQAIPGIGNGLLQDILFLAKCSPKRKVNTLTEIEKNAIFSALQETIQAVFEKKGRNTMTYLFGEAGSYQELMRNPQKLCPICHTPLVEEAYLGGKVIYCGNCQS